jgi:hypothetical protein
MTKNHPKKASPLERWDMPKLSRTGEVRKTPHKASILLNLSSRSRPGKPRKRLNFSWIRFRALIREFILTPQRLSWRVGLLPALRKKSHLALKSRNNSQNHGQLPIEDAYEIQVVDGDTPYLKETA